MKNMHQVGFLLHRVNTDISNKDNLFINKMLEKCASIIENDINRENGILGIDFKIHFLSLNKPNHNQTIQKYLKKNPSILCTHGTVLLEEILDTKEIIFFKTTYKKLAEIDKIKDSTTFFNMRVFREAKVQHIKDILKKFPKLNNVYLLHDGLKRLKNSEKDISKAIKKKIKCHDFSLFYDSTKNVATKKQIEKLKEINAKIIKNIGKNDVLILDTRLIAVKNLINYFNEKPTEIGLVLLANGNIEGQFDGIHFPMIEMKSAQNVFLSLDLQNLIKKIPFKITNAQKALFVTASAYLDYILLFKYAANKIFKKPNNRKDFVEQIKVEINKINNKEDIFVGLRNIMAFKDNVNIYRNNYAFIFPKSLNNERRIKKVFYDTQFIPVEGKVKPVNVLTLSIDIKRVTNIDISNGTWGAEFFLIITSKYKDPINFIIFNNLSMISREFKSKLISFNSSKTSGSFSYKYYIVANFDFEPIADNFPFDWQHIYISYSISDEEKYGIIQPIPETLLDKEFVVEGWKIKDAITGIKRNKNVEYSDYQLLKKVSVEEVARVGWTLARANYITLTKIVIPLTFLMFLNYYVLFFTYETALSQIGILTTTFLSGIALYFSAERPQPLRLTTIDLIFIWYYIQSGIIIVTSAISYKLGENKFYESMYLLKFIAPIGLIALMVFLFFRIKAIRLRPNIS